ncbi:SHOCT domain-containing protein [Natronomonas marina]|jgi:uncharacterized membrane protein|uniref:SHOCT domain-containing protein n=1 Tax=Natronomonas marina TaxID=2961939 RepID=UPI0020C98792|nr:SHOCT domain-containing protein [Natronomonas marina]
MAGVEVLPEGSAGVVSMLVLVAGLGALFAGLEWFWVVFVVGYAGLVPLTAMLSRDDDEERETSSADPEGRASADDSRTDALETLRERYARGELTHEEFERKLEALLETDSPEHAEKRVERNRDREGTRE